VFEQQLRPENFFLRDVCALRESAKPFLGQYPVARRTGFEKHSSIALLQTVLTAEIVCVLRYTMISVSEDGLRNGWIGAEFQAQANDERKHMQMAAGRIEQLGGTPNFHPDGLASRIAVLSKCNGDFAKRVSENLAAEQCVIEHYRDLMEYFSDRDPQTCAMLKEIINDEENHASDMLDILTSYMA
jgi:bacterioferritin